MIPFPLPPFNGTNNSTETVQAHKNGSCFSNYFLRIISWKCSYIKDCKHIEGFDRYCQNAWGEVHTHVGSLSCVGLALFIPLANTTNQQSLSVFGSWSKGTVSFFNLHYIDWWWVWKHSRHVYWLLFFWLLAHPMMVWIWNFPCRLKCQTFACLTLPASHQY